jgi:large subunit ribosomal protein L6
MPVAVPDKVKITINGKKISAEGPKGRMDLNLPRLTTIELSGKELLVRRANETSEAKALHGLARSLVNNLVSGVHTGFQKKLEIQGVGFKASVQGNVVNLSLGYSHPINYPIPAGVKVTVEENTKVTIEGASKEDVGRVASEIRAYYPPEPYKGKGVRYQGETVLRKEGKTVQ